MNKKIVSLSLAVILAGSLAGCTLAPTPEVSEGTVSSTPSMSAPSASSEASSEASPTKESPEKVMSVAENLAALSSASTALLSDAKFREAFSAFLETGKKPNGHEKAFEKVSELVAKDKAFESEKKAYLAAAKDDGAIITGGEDVDLYLSAVVVLNTLNPELLDSTEAPKYELDEKLLVKKDGLLTWKNDGGLRVVDKNGVITAVGIPMNAQYFTADGSKLSAQGIPTYLANFNKSTFNAAAMSSLLADVQAWIDANAEKVEAETDISGFTEDIFKDSEIEAGSTIGINGTVKEYVIDLVTEDGSSTITSSGETSFSKKTLDSFELAKSDVSTAWDAYETIYLMKSSESEGAPSLEAIVKDMQNSDAVKGAKWSIGKSKDGTAHVVVVIGDSTYKFYDITAVAG